MEHTQCVVIGAGVVGLAAARALALTGREVVLIERETRIGSVTSARNSEVIHAGLHYPPGSLKARTCVAGRDLLYAYCEERQVPHRRCGKLIVATSAAQATQLDRLARQAQANGVADLQRLHRDQVAEMEPELRCEAALLSPSTGIVDSHAYMQCLLADAQAAGAQLALASTVSAGAVAQGGIELEVTSQTAAGSQHTRLWAREVVNAAGLGAGAVAASIAGLSVRAVTPSWFAKGQYFSLSGRAPFKRLVYPVPEPGGLGVHLTLDLAGQARFGPDVQWLDITREADIDYRVDPTRQPAFEAAIRAYWPGLPQGALQPGYAGVRPKVAPPGQEGDFILLGPQQHGTPGWVQLAGIESPGLTASLALAQSVVQALG